jgi:POT family proton-dependent oligopeptide transporter
VVESLGAKFKNLLLVLGNLRFMAFLLIFSLYWIIFWQIFIVVPFYITDYISADAPFEIIISVGAWGIILFQLPINRLTKGLSPRTAILTGFAVSSFCWLIVALHPSIPTFIAGILVFSVGEMMQAPRYYEYISSLAPKGQQGLFQGYAFLPIAIAWLVGGTLGGWLYATYAKEAGEPVIVFLVIFGIGVLATLLMGVYNRVVSARERAAL